MSRRGSEAVGPNPDREEDGAETRTKSELFYLGW